MSDIDDDTRDQLLGLNHELVRVESCLRDSIDHVRDIQRDINELIEEDEP